MSAGFPLPPNEPITDDILMIHFCTIYKQSEFFFEKDNPLLEQNILKSRR